MMRKIAFSLPLLALMFALAACNRVEANLTDQLLPELEEQASQVVTTPTSEPQTAVEPTAEAQPVDECLACHTNKELLIQVAEPEVEVESESEGTG